MAEKGNGEKTTEGIREKQIRRWGVGEIGENNSQPSTVDRPRSMEKKLKKMISLLWTVVCGPWTLLGETHVRTI